MERKKNARGPIGFFVDQFKMRKKKYTRLTFSSIRIPSAMNRSFQFLTNWPSQWPAVQLGMDELNEIRWMNDRHFISFASKVRAKDTLTLLSPDENVPLPNNLLLLERGKALCM